jgi:hypothetical protein
MKSDDCHYRPELPMQQLIVVIRDLLGAERHVDRLLCRYLADLADRIESRAGYDLGGFSDVYHAARCLFDMSVRRTRECIRIGRALRALPQVERAFVDGRLTFSRVREVTRVARPEDEAQWLRLASELPMRVLERRVAEAGGSTAPDPRTSDAAEVAWKTSDVVEVRLTLRAESWALLQRAMEGARRADEGQTLLSDGDALEAVARDAMGAQAAIDGQPAIAGRTSAGADVRRTVVLYECRACKRTEIETGAGPIEVGEVAAAALGCGAAVIDLATEGRLERRGGPLPTAVARAVRLRDRDRCRVPGCSRRRYVDVHHIVERARGGVHSRKNCLCLCGTHHRMLHERQLVIAGDPEGAIDFFDGAGRRLADAGRAEGGVTHSGSSEEAGAMLPGEGRRVLATMGARGGWSIDELCAATGLPPGTVAGTLIECELAGRACCDAAGRYQALH